MKKFSKRQSVTVTPIMPYLTCLTNGLSHHYHLGESTFIVRDIRTDIIFLFHFSIKNSLIKQTELPQMGRHVLRITSGTVLFAFVP